MPVYSRSLGFQKLPTEIIEMIILDGAQWHQSNTGLLQFMLVCRQWYTIAAKKLYYSIVLDVRERVPDGFWTPKLRIWSLLRTLGENKRVASYVQKLDIYCSPPEDDMDWHITMPWRHQQEIIASEQMKYERECPIKYLSVMLSEMSHLKTLRVPAFLEHFEDIYPGIHLHSNDIVSLIQKWPEIQEISVRELTVRSVKTPRVDSRFNIDPNVNAGELEKHRFLELSETFFKEFPSVWKKEVYDFGGIINGSVVACEELIKCLNAWSPNLRSLRLQTSQLDFGLYHGSDILDSGFFYEFDIPDYGLYHRSNYQPEDSGIEMLTKAIWQLPNLERLCVASNILPDSALKTNSGLEKLEYLQYYTTKVQDCSKFIDAFLSRREPVLFPELKTLDLGLLSLARTAKDEGLSHELSVGLKRLFSYCSERGITLEGWYEWQRQYKSR